MSLASSADSSFSVSGDTSIIVPQEQPFPTAGEWMFSILGSTFILTWFVIFTPDLYHWFILPVYISGCIVGTEVIRTLRGKVDTFDPQSLVAIVGYHLFFMAPMLHVRWDSWMQYIVPPADWRPWLGQFAWLNVAGLILYMLGKGWILDQGTWRKPTWSFQLDASSFQTLLLFLLATSFALQVVIYASYGGISGYIAAFESQTAFRGMGALFFYSESFPMLAFIGFVVWAAKRNSKAGWPMILAALLAFVILRVFFGGLRGSRANLIWGGFWALGMVHLCLRPIQKKALVAVAMVAIVFMYLYGFYKSVGSDVLSLLSQPGGVQRLNEMTGRSLEFVLLSDLGRSDVQAFVLHQLSPGGRNLPYVFPYGQTYIHALTLPFPSGLVPVNSVSKLDVGTYVLQAGSTRLLGNQRESRVYGLAGEALLNFGKWAVPIAYLLFGIGIGYASRWISSVDRKDTRILMAPFVAVLAFYPLIWDADNVVVFALQFGLVPGMLLYASSRKNRMLRE